MKALWDMGFRPTAPLAATPVALSIFPGLILFAFALIK
ncbi:hypothetical protein LMG27177_02680 [Paraburkholderia fynbosensis]|uniref:Uncharacterized protein n=1 Tax=Paraburkholderia fynbosensis TaxID=1200993 RepID=A0A6J5G1Z5_9BURK|nr:hypothetical protein LMG27177_02680 [Paraburkholderia fynbosensis]